MVTIIVKKSRPKGRTRTSTDRELVDSGWGSSFASEEDRDKCSYIERRLKEKYNMDDSRVISRYIKKIK